MRLGFPLVAVVSTIWRLYAHERPLFVTGLFGLGLGLVCFAGMLFHGVIVEPEGNLYKAASFNIAVGIFHLTLALITRVAGFSRRGWSIWRWTIIGLTLYGYSVETIQIFRGFDPRFSRVSTPLDQAIGGLFFLSAVGIFICFLALTLRFFFRSPDPLVLALRYGSVAAIAAFLVGIVMSVVGAPRFGDEGNLLPLHATGFHGLQAVPLVALGMVWAKVEESRAKRAVHAAGLLWFVVGAGIAWQSFSGRPVLEPSIPMGLAALALGGWAFVAWSAVDAFRRSQASLEGVLAG